MKRCFPYSIFRKPEILSEASLASGSGETASLPDVQTDRTSSPASWPETAEVREAAGELSRYIENMLAPTAWRFIDSPPDDPVFPSRERWTCFFAFMKNIQAGRPLVISADATGCPGASFYLGLHELPLLGATIYLAGLERFKKDIESAKAFYLGVKPVFDRDAMLAYQRLDDMPDAAAVEVVNLWVGVDSLSKLMTLANFDRATNDNVIMPFASGCQSIWTLPYKEKLVRQPRAVAGALDPTVRKYLPSGAMSFSVPANRFVEMCRNIDASFLGS